MVDLAPFSRPTGSGDDRDGLGVREDGTGRCVRRCSIFWHREVLLVLDTCEHMVADCAALSRRCSTRRRPADHRDQPGGAGRSGEVVWRVPRCRFRRPDRRRPMRSWSPKRSQLFVERASAFDMAFHADQRTRSDRPDLPAPRRDSARDRTGRGPRPVLTTEQIESRLQDRFRLLTGGPGRRSRASGRSKRRWTGATICCRTANGSCSVGFGVSRIVDHRCRGEHLREGRRSRR